MNKKNIIYMIFGIVIGILLISILLIPLLLKANNKTTSNETKNINNEEVLPSVKEDTPSKEELETDNNTISSTPIPTPSPTPQVKEEVVTYTEEELLNSLNNDSNNINTTSIKENVKSTFIAIIDFIFYNKEIKGYTFSELTLNAKLQVIKIALTVDNKIDKYFPEYKDFIKDKYTKVKSELIILYLNTTTKVCKTLPENSCLEARKDFKSMKESFNFTFDLIKSFLSNKVELLEEWYLSIK